MKSTAHAQIEVPYNHDLKRLEDVLSRVQRPGDFFVSGVLETPMPRIEIDGVGVISFPIPASQIQEIVRRGDRAPYGRGGETILDSSVRNAWQLSPTNVRIGGKSWEHAFEEIRSTVTAGLGCTGMEVSAELYKLLVYEEGGFFLPHRDTEKVDGMFGTLTIVLPSLHHGGELIVRHAARDVTVDLSKADISELAFAAFYADCEHEIRPVTNGARVCLTYNLLQRKTGKKDRTITAPIYDAEVGQSAAILRQTFQGSSAPAKLAWLLEHDYSPAGLSFAALKGRDAALAGVVRHAAEQAGCALHLGIVHIEESGAAEPFFVPDYGRRRRWGRDYRDDIVVEDDETRFEVIEVFDGSQYIDQWIDTHGRAMEFGSLPLEDGEVLPAGALDGEKPDQQRLTEATGNEGASFERSYHRAALVIWPRDRFVDVLLQAGPAAALPYLKDCVQACNSHSASAVDTQGLHRVAERIVDAWEGDAKPAYRDRQKEADRSQMLALLGEVGDAPLVERFITGIVTREYDGTENERLAGSVHRLGAKRAGQLLSRLVSENSRSFPCECVDLLLRLTRELERPFGDWKTALHNVGAAIVETLPNLKLRKSDQWDREWRRTRKAGPVGGKTISDLLETLAALNEDNLQDAASTSIIANPAVFNPATVIVPALQILNERNGDGVFSDRTFQQLWRHSAEFLLRRSEQPPEPPKHWRQDVKISCPCNDCRELQAFARDPASPTYRFRVRKERRQHLHHQIDQHDLDMTHTTERTGSPQTLVCTKTRRTYEQQCQQYKDDLASMGVLREVLPQNDDDIAAFAARIEAATRRRP